MACRFRCSRESRTPESLSSLSMGISSGIGCMRDLLSVDIQGIHMTSEACLAGVHLGKGFKQRLLIGLLVEPLFEDGLDGSIAGVVKEKGAPACSFQALSPTLIPQPDNALGRSEVVQYPVGKERFDQLRAKGADGSGLLEAPLRISHLIGQRIGGQVGVHG